MEINEEFEYLNFGRRNDGENVKVIYYYIKKIKFICFDIFEWNLWKKEIILVNNFCRKFLGINFVILFF